MSILYVTGAKSSEALFLHVGMMCHCLFIVVFKLAITFIIFFLSKSLCIHALLGREFVISAAAVVTVGKIDMSTASGTFSE